MAERDPSQPNRTTNLFQDAQGRWWNHSTVSFASPTHVKIISDLTTEIDVNFREKFNDLTKKDVTFLTVNMR
jgi:hypothetical protein